MLDAKGLSFREFISKNYAVNIEIFRLVEVLSDSNEIALQVTREFIKHKLDLLQLFKEYLQQGYFPTRDHYSSEKIYYDSLINSINSTIDSDISSVHNNVDNISKQKIKLLLKHIALKCPFTPNIKQLSRDLDITNDNSLKKYLFYLHEGGVLTNLYASNRTHKDFQKPQKIFLNNTNFSYAFSDVPNIGTIRETFVANCLFGEGDLTAPTYGDFCLDNKWTFEIGGKSKTKRQIKSITDSFVFADDTLSVTDEIIPLWMLGFLW